MTARRRERALVAPVALGVIALASFAVVAFGRGAPTGPTADAETPGSATSQPTSAAAIEPPAPGVLVSANPMTALGPQMVGWRITFGSRDGRGRALRASGSVIRPAGPAPAGGFPVVAWGHSTVGIALSCVPSRSGETPPGLDAAQLLAQGYAIVSADFANVGTGGSPYLDGPTEGRAMLDALRAARTLPEARATGRAVLWGYSQGGQAALFAAQRAPAEAADLPILGAVAAAPPVTARFVAESLTEPARLQFGLLGVAALLDRHAELRAADVLTPAGVDLVRALGDDGAGFCPDVVKLIADRPPSALVHTDPWSLPRWRAALEDTSLPEVRSGVPVLVLAAFSDAIVPPSEARAAVARLCRAGSTVELRGLWGNHFQAATADVPLQWISDRFAGRPPTQGCAPPT